MKVINKKILIILWKLYLVSLLLLFQDLSLKLSRQEVSHNVVHFRASVCDLTCCQIVFCFYPTNNLTLVVTL